MRKKKQISGLTLVELVIAVTVLAVGVAGIITAFQVGVRQSALANDITMAGIEAQLWMERLVGLFEAEMEIEIAAAPHNGSRSPDENNLSPFPSPSGDFWMSIVIADNADGLGNLRDVTVFVHRTNDPDDWFFRHSNILNVTGFLV